MIGKFVLTAAVLGSLIGASQADAHADYTFAMCPSGRSGVASTVTSCEFADNVRQEYFHQSGPRIYAYSPVTDRTYEMWCSPNVSHFYNGLTLNTILCEGGTDARVVVF